MISESGGQQEVCAEIKSGNLSTPVTVQFSTADGVATGKFVYFFRILTLALAKGLAYSFSYVQCRMTTLQLPPPLPSVLLRAKIV